MNCELVCKALGNVQRIRLVLCLRTPKNVSQLLQLCTLSQSALSQHLRVLRDADIVTTTRSGREIVYRLTSSRYARIAQLLAE